MNRPLCCRRGMTLGIHYTIDEPYWFCFKCKKEEPRKVKKAKKLIVNTDPVLALD